MVPLCSRNVHDKAVLVRRAQWGNHSAYDLGRVWGGERRCSVATRIQGPSLSSMHKHQSIRIRRKNAKGNIDYRIRSLSLVGEGGHKLSKYWVSKYTLLPSECVAYRSYAARIGLSRLDSWAS